MHLNVVLIQTLVITLTMDWFSYFIQRTIVLFPPSLDLYKELMYRIGELTNTLTDRVQSRTYDVSKVNIDK